MVHRLPAWIFIALALAIMGFALLPVMRASFGIDQEIQMQFLSVVMLLIAGLMCGLTGMLLLARRQPDISQFSSITPSASEINCKAAILHSTGLLIFSGVPLANFLVCYYLWVRYRYLSPELDTHGREVICQQITFYLFAMMCLFMALMIIGIFGLVLLMLLQFATSLIGVSMALQGKVFRYPANIAIIDRRI